MGLTDYFSDEEIKHFGCQILLKKSSENKIFMLVVKEDQSNSEIYSLSMVVESPVIETPSLSKDDAIKQIFEELDKMPEYILGDSVYDIQRMNTRIASTSRRGVGNVLFGGYAWYNGKPMKNKSGKESYIIDSAIYFVVDPDTNLYAVYPNPNIQKYGFKIIEFMQTTI